MLADAIEHPQQQVISTMDVADRIYALADVGSRQWFNPDGNGACGPE
jgi:hypothetical protein